MRAFERLIRDFDKAKAKRERKELGVENFRLAAVCYGLAVLMGVGTIDTDDAWFGVLGLMLAALGAGFLDHGFMERGRR